MKKSNAALSKAGGQTGPLTSEEVFQRENIPASQPIPASIAQGPRYTGIFLSSDNKTFDPRKHFRKVRGLAKNVWQLVTEEAVVNGLTVEKAERIKPGSIKFEGNKAARLAPFRPPWQPYIYHPKIAALSTARRMLRRKSGAAVTPHVVFNRDDRELFQPIGFPWHCVGQLSVTTSNAPSRPQLGTGTLVGARTVLTSGHMIPWDESEFTIKFAPAFSQFFLGIPAPLPAGVPRESFVTGVLGYDPRIREGDLRQAWDLAVLRLQEPLGAMLGAFGAAVYRDDWEDDTRWTLVGYPKEIGVRTTSIFPLVKQSITTDSLSPTRQFRISVEDSVTDGSALELQHRADATEGNSGGPLFGHWPDGPYVIGVHSGGQGYDANVAAGGHAMVDLVRWARANWT